MRETWTQRTPDQRKRVGRNISRAQKQRWDKTSNERRKEIGGAMSAGRLASDFDISASVTKIWQERTTEERAVIGRNVRKGQREAGYDFSAVSTWYHTLPSGRKILCQSNWEAHWFGLLETVFPTIEWDRGGVFDLIERNWLPDTAIFNDSRGPLLVEVKGHPTAQERFDTVHLPLIWKYRVKGHAVAVLTRNTGKFYCKGHCHGPCTPEHYNRYGITSWEEMLAQLHWVIPGNYPVTQMYEPKYKVGKG
jgi:hypothetical protein